MSQDGACLGCSAGQFTGAAGLLKCDNCPANTLLPYTSAAKCLNCPSDYVSEPGSVKQSQCNCRQAGTGQVQVYDNRNLSSCVCDKGYSVQFGSISSCRACDNMHYKGILGPTPCQRCEPYGYRYILELPAGAACAWDLQPAEGGNRSDQCECWGPPGSQYYSRSESVWNAAASSSLTTDTLYCHKCPSHMWCPGGQMVYASSGHWRLVKETWNVSDAAFAIMPCTPPEACLGPNISEPCNNETCAAGYQGLVCSGCVSPGYTKDRSNGRCIPCEGPAWGSLVLVCLGAAAALCFIYYVASRSGDDEQPGKDDGHDGSSMAVLTIACNYMFVVSMFPLSMGPMSKYLASIFSLDISRGTVYLCLSSFEDQYVLSLWLPLVACILLAAIVCMRHGMDQTALKRWVQCCAFVVLYTAATSTFNTVSAYGCETYQYGAHDLRLLSVDRSIVCGSPRHDYIVRWAVPFMVVFVIGLPSLLILRLFGVSKYGLRLLHVSFLQKPYRDDASSLELNWEALSLMRRMCLVVLSIQTTTAKAQVVGVNLILFFSVLAHARLKPFKRKVHNVMEIASLSLNFVLFDVALVGQSNLTVLWVLDIMRLLALLGLLVYALYERFAAPANRQVYHSESLDESLLEGALPPAVRRPELQQQCTLGVMWNSARRYVEQCLPQ